MSSTEKNKTTAGGKNKKAKKTKLEKARTRRKIINGIMGVIIFFTLLGGAIGVSTIKMVIDRTDVDLDLKDLASSQVSFVYDTKGEEIARLGVEDRINITYNDLPQCVVDAFVAVEDSRFFEHSGFDLPRFAKAFLVNLRTLSFSQGGSTITMQVIKNSYFAVDTIASRDGADGLSRKIQEIYFSMKINNLVSKGKILELYINKVNYGASARGIEVGADYYFNKSASELNLVEAAYLAGVINAPNDYNAYWWPEDAQLRLEDVLYQMHYHGYISDTEYAAASKVRIIDLLAGAKSTTYGSGKTIKNQAYLDQVLNELEDVYDINIYTDAVRVYTALNQEVQAVCDKASDGLIADFRDDYINYASAVVQNSTGLIVGICGGRDYDQARKFNYATQGRIQPGSTIKALLSYPLSFEHLGLSNASTIRVEPIYLDGSNIVVVEDEGGYYGDVSIERAFCSSYNVAAIKLLRQVRNTIGDDAVRSYLRSIGFDNSVVENFNEQFAIGGMDCLISPLQLAGAGTMLLNGGKYITPHTITRIEYIDGSKDPITPNYTSTQVISPGAAWLTSLCMSINVNNNLQSQGDVIGNVRAMYFRRGAYKLYCKTGTTSLPEDMYYTYNLPASASKDQWLLVNNGDFSIGSWIGYDLSVNKNKNTWISVNERSLLRDSIIDDNIFSALEREYGYPKNSNPMPSEITRISFIKGLSPFTAAPSYAEGANIATGYVLSKFAKVESFPLPTIDSIEKVSASIKDRTVNVSWTAYPDASKLKVAGNTTVVSAGGRSYTIPIKYDESWINGPIRYYLTISDSRGVVLVDEELEKNSYSYVYTDFNTKPDQLTISVYYKYTKAPVNSNTVTTTVTMPPITQPDPEPGPSPDPNPEA